ncbi:MAG: M50 family metallopeptidase [Planctomycetota bacterium]|nr:M50 family metallopeptidase [Planctomycetota bacterium]
MRILTATHRLGTICGIEVRAMFLLYVFLAAIFLLRALAEGGSANLLWPAAIVALYALSVLLHELGHALTARRLGLRVRGILLHPLGGLACLEGRPPRPGMELAIALAGPMVSLCIALAAWLICQGSGVSAAQALYARDDHPLPALMASGLFINLSLALFNLLPIFPLDGGRAFAALAEALWGPQAARAFSRRASTIGVYLLAGVGLWCWLYRNPQLGLLLIILAYFIFQMSAAERAYGPDDEKFAEADAGEVFFTPVGNGDQPSAKRGWWERWRKRRQQQQAEAEAAARADEAQRLDALLAKIKEKGLASLTPAEAKFLTEASLRQRERMHGKTV